MNHTKTPTHNIKQHEKNRFVRPPQIAGQARTKARDLGEEFEKRLVVILDLSEGGAQRTQRTQRCVLCGT